MTAYAIIGFSLFITIITGIVGGYAGFSVNGVPVAEGGTIGLDSISFLYHIITFGVDDMPLFLGAFFLILMLLNIFVVVRLIRGSD